MGDHRASIKIEMEFHGIKDNTDMWINYWPHECCNMDKRVIDFFNSVYERGMEEYNKKDADYWKNRKKQEELAELKRLKDKYET